MDASAPSLGQVAAHLDDLLRTTEVPDYPGALNGVQVDHAGPVRRCAVAVDASLRTIRGAVDAGANLLIVHHGLFWGGMKPVRGRQYERLRSLLLHDIAVYSSHLPLDLHPTVGNNVLLAELLGLDPQEGFARFQTILVGVRGTTDIETSLLADRVRSISEREGGTLHAIGMSAGRRTRRWAICTGAGASSETLGEAVDSGIDTLIVGEGPHHTAVEAEELGVAVLYMGHYASETLGVRALGADLERTFGLPWSFVAAPSGR
jgi:dinuclear metal center YbgI/SA1388 family protein